MLVRRLKSLSREELDLFVAENIRNLVEDEALELFDNPFITPRILGSIAQNQRLTAFYSIRLRLVAHRQTPQAHAVKFIHYLYWFDLLRLAGDVKIPAPVRRAIETQLVNKASELSLGERVSSARRCTPALVKIFLFDPDPKVFEALLVNKRLREDDLLQLINSGRATVEQLMMIAGDMKWSYRYAIRKALVMNPGTPRAAAASQLRHLSRNDLRQIHSAPQTSVYLRRCIERIRPEFFSAPLERLE